ncbi:SDR family oxidoreductase [Celerinatantimonas sp. YJH-8]|uniref:SDR family oxidoreductase n=1 Tax=Celerinatantimonas sp. YJH-8 TaxID=3228714 RepID=UPI0038C3FAE5
MKILLAGATGYLGCYIAKELQRRHCFFRVIARSPEKLQAHHIEASEVIQAELTQPETLRQCCQNIDVVISTVGITRQKDGLSYRDVDYQANMNLLHEALLSGVRKFIYVGVLRGEELRHLKICDAKEQFVEQLKNSGIDYCVIRPNGFFSDISEIFKMAQKGRVYLFGNGSLRANPIHGADLAVACVDAIASSETEFAIGGPETLTQHEIATLAFHVLGQPPKITYIPDWVRVAFMKSVTFLTPQTVYGPLEFFMTVLAMDMRAPEYGHHTLRDYFTHLHQMKP